MRVLLFHSLKQAVGSGHLTVEPAPATVEALIEHLVSLHPELKPHLPTVLVAVNEEWADRSAPLQPDDEVALMPPVSGG